MISEVHAAQAGEYRTALTARRGYLGHDKDVFLRGTQRSDVGAVEEVVNRGLLVNLTAGGGAVVEQPFDLN